MKSIAASIGFAIAFSQRQFAIFHIPGKSNIAVFYAKPGRPACEQPQDRILFDFVLHFDKRERVTLDEGSRMADLHAIIEGLVKEVGAGSMLEVRHSTEFALCQILMNAAIHSFHGRFWRAIRQRKWNL